MPEWKFTLLNGAVGTLAALIVGALAFWAAFRQGSKAVEAAQRQAEAAIQAVVESGRRQHELARWQARRDTYVKLLASADAFQRVATDFAARRLSPLRGEDLPDVWPLSEAFDAVLFAMEVVKLEGPKEAVGRLVDDTRSKGQSLQFAVVAIGVQRPDGRTSLDEYQETRRRFDRSLRELKDAMYEVLHATD